MEIKNNNGCLLDKYLERFYPDVDINNEIFQRYYDTTVDMLSHCNFILLPRKEIVKQSKGNVQDRTYECDLVIQDDNYGGGLIIKSVKVDQLTDLQNYNSLKTFIQLQDQRATLDVPKQQRDKFRDLVIINMMAGYKAVFGLEMGFEIDSIGFGENGKIFQFNDGVLDFADGTFERNSYKLSQDVDINITYPAEEVDSLDLNQSLSDLQAIEKYISDEKTISAVTLGYLIGGLFRESYKKIQNEFPFLGIEGYTGFGKTSLLNFLSRIAGYNWSSVTVGDSEYAFEVAMNSISGYLYFIDEIQKSSKKFLNLIQASYNSGKNHKGGGDGDWSKIKVYNKDCSLVCTGEVLPYHDEAFLNRFIILNPTKYFCVKKSVCDPEEFEKYYKLTGTKVESKYLNTQQIKTLAIDYYRPRFMNVLKNRDKIDFIGYNNKAKAYIEDLYGSSIDTRLKNNLSLAITGYLIVKGDSVDEDEIKLIIIDYFDQLLEYRKDNILSGKVVQYIKENIGEFTSRVPKIKGFSSNNPMIYLKATDREKGIVIQIQRLVRYVGDKLQSPLDAKHLEQQFRQLIGETKTKTRVVKVAKGEINLIGTFIPLSRVKENNYLIEIWDTFICTMVDRMGEIRHILQGEDKGDMYHGVQPITKVMPDDVLEKLLEEMRQTMKKAPCFIAEKYDSKIRDEYDC